MNPEELYDEWIPGERLQAYDTPRARAKRELAQRAKDTPKLAPHGGCNWKGCPECFPNDKKGSEMGYKVYPIAYPLPTPPPFFTNDRNEALDKAFELSDGWAEIVVADLDSGQEYVIRRLLIVADPEDDNDE